ncbi:hypothetical protein BGZ95_007699, partial [Linnemannia exigua]
LPPTHSLLRLSQPRQSATSWSSSRPRRPTTSRMFMPTSSLFGASPFLMTMTATFLFCSTLCLKRRSSRQPPNSPKPLTLSYSKRLSTSSSSVLLK